jgi:Immunity protein 26
MNIAIESGLVFAIPLAEKTFGFGQLIAWQRPIFYMAGYDMKGSSPDDMNEQDMRKARPALLGNFFDILIRNGRWLPVGKMEAPNIPFPCFKIRIEDTFRVESWDRQQTREATSDECSALQFRSNHSAIVLENALKAYFDLSPWEPRFDGLKVDAVAKSSRMFSRN